MPDTEILVDRSPGETRVAILVDGRLDEVWIERLGQPALVGSIVMAPVAAVRRGLGAVFLDLGDSDGYLDKLPDPPPNQGETLLVEVMAEAHRGKAARVSTDLRLHGAFVTISPTRPGHAVARAITAKGERRRLRELLSQTIPDDIGALVHGHAKGYQAADLEADARALVERWSRIKDHPRKQAGSARFQVLEAAPGPLSQARRLAPNATIHEGRDGMLFRARDLDQELARATERRVELHGGAALVIDETEALVAIDVDIARATMDNPVALANQVATEIARRIRLRRLAGQILIDFPRSGSSDARRALVSGLEQAFTHDPDQPTLHGWTRGGLLELTRPRRGPSLVEIFRDANRTASFNATTDALEALRRVLRETSGIAHPRLICPNPVKLALQGPLRAALDEVERRLGAPLALESGPATNHIEITGD
jgi:ribonuclease G